MLKRFLKFIGYFILVIILLMSIAIWMVSTEKYQNILAQKGAKYLSEKLHTKVVVNHVSLSFFNHFNVEGIYVEDLHKDTLAYVGKLQLQTSELLSNYWNNEKSVIKTIHLENAYIHLKRSKDSIWNYHFIESAFASAPKKKTSSSNTTKDTSKFDPKIDLKKLSCSNVRFYMDDGWRGEDMNFGVAQLDLDANQIHFIQKEIKLNSIKIDNANIVIREYVGYRGEDKTPDDTTTWGTPFNPDHFKIDIANLSIQNSKFTYDDGSDKPSATEFDAKHIGVSDLNLSLTEAKVINDTLFTTLDFKAKEQCGLTINSLRSNVKLSQVQTVLDNLHLETNKSILTDYYEMNYKNFHDFNDYISKVKMKAHLENTILSASDIGYFSNTLNQYPLVVNLKADVNGTVDHLVGENMLLHAKNTSFAGKASVVGLPDIKTTFFNLDVTELATTGKDLNLLIPQTRVDAIAWNKLENINFKGNYKGTIDQFYTKGNLKTSLGDALLDLNMNFKPKQTTYAGNIETENFDLGNLLKQSTLGKISLKGSIDGSGFDLDNLNAKINASVSNIEIDHKSYSNLTINGLVEKKKFDGIFISQDPSLALNFDGKLDLSGKQPVYNFNSRILRFDLQKFGLTKEHIIGSGVAKLNFTGDNIDNFTGTASLQNVVIEQNGKTLYLDNILLESFQVAKEKTLKLTSSVADATVRGDFSISELPNAVQLYLYHYLPEYINRPQHFKDEEFVFEVKVKEIDSILTILLPSITGISGTVVSGNLNTYTQSFSLDANIPSVGYNKFSIHDLYIVGAGDYNEFNLNSNSGVFYYNQDTIVPSFQVNTVMARDTASLSITTQSVNDIVGDASLNLTATAFNDNLYVNILPSSLSIKQDKWQLYSRSNLVFGKETSVKDLVLENGAQKIVLNTIKNATNDLEASVSELDLESFSNYLNLKKPSYFGRLNGVVNVTDFMNTPIITADIYSNGIIRADRDTLGILKAVVSYNVATQNLVIDNQTALTNGVDKASANGHINFKDSTVNLKTNLQNTNIAIVNQFVSDFIQNMQGIVTGNVAIVGNLNDPTISGHLDLNNASLKVIYLGTTYFIDKAKLDFNNNRIDIDDVTIKDERAGEHTGLLSGYITHHNFNDMRLHFNVRSNDFLCLNTHEWENELFYGYMPAKVNIDVTGSIDDITLDIDAKPLKGSTFIMPISSSSDASKFDYIHFASIGKDQEEQKKSNNYFKMNMNIEATPDAEISIIMDKNTNERIVAKGNGDLKLNLDLGNEMKMFGTYTITEGKYLFNFRGAFPKDFIIDEGSKISWSGSPLEARLDVNAIYRVPKSISLAPLVANLKDLGVDDADDKKTYETFVSLFLKGSLGNPDIKFDITQPSNKVVTSPGYKQLELIKNDETELISQAGILLLFGEFKSTTGLGQGVIERGGITTASDMITSALSSSISNVFNELTGLKNININIGHQAYALGAEGSNLNRNQITFGISANLFKDRVVVDFGNSVDIDRSSAGKTTSNYNIGGDFKAHYLITEDGRFRANAFRTATYDESGKNITKGGLGLSYRKVFNSFSDLFTSKRKKKKQVVTDTNKTDS